MQGSPCPFGRFGSNCPLHGATGMHGTADASRHKQPGEESHLYPSDKTTMPHSTPIVHAYTWIKRYQPGDRRADLSDAGSATGWTTHRRSAYRHGQGPPAREPTEHLKAA